MEAADATVSMELQVRSLFVVGPGRQDIEPMIPRKTVSPAWEIDRWPQWGGVGQVNCAVVERHHPFAESGAAVGPLRLTRCLGLPEGEEVELIIQHMNAPDGALTTSMSEGLVRVYAILGERDASGHTDTVARHNEHLLVQGEMGDEGTRGPDASTRHVFSSTQPGTDRHDSERG